MKFHARLVRTLPRSIVVRVQDRDVQIPNSQLGPDSELYPDCGITDGTIEIPEWLAIREGLVETEQKVPLPLKQDRLAVMSKGQVSRIADLAGFWIQTTTDEGVTQYRDQVLAVWDPPEHGQELQELAQAIQDLLQERKKLIRFCVSRRARLQEID